MVHAYQKGKLKHAPAKVREIADHISEEDAEHFAKTRHEGLPERRGKERREEKAAAWRAGFLWKCAEYGIDGNALLKTAGPSLRDRAAAGVPGAKARLRESEARQAANKSLSNMADKQRLNERGRQYLASLPPEERQKFYRDMWGNAIRTRMGLASAAAGFGGMGLVGGSAMEGAGEALASKAEGRSTAASLGRGAVAGGASYGVGKGVAAVGRHVVTPAYRAVSSRIANALDSTNPMSAVGGVKAGIGTEGNGTVAAAAWDAAKRARPGRARIAFDRLIGRDPYRKSVNAATDTIAKHVTNSYIDAGSGEETLKAIAKNLAEATGKSSLSKNDLMLLRLFRQHPDIVAKNKDMAMRVLGRNIGSIEHPNYPDLDNWFYAFSRQRPKFSTEAGKQAYEAAVKAGTPFYDSMLEGARAEAAANAAEFDSATFLKRLGRAATAKKPMLGKELTHDELMRQLKDTWGDAIFKGSQGVRAGEKFSDPFHSGGDLWYSHNPYVSEGYATGEGQWASDGLFMATPLGENGALTAEEASRRFTPHVSLGKETERLAAAARARNAERTGTAINRMSGRGSWGDDGHYEIVLHGPETQRALDYGRLFIASPGRTPLNNNTMIVRGPTGGFGDTTRFFEVPKNAVMRYRNGDGPLKSLALESPLDNAIRELHRPYGMEVMRGNWRSQLANTLQLGKYF